MSETPALASRSPDDDQALAQRRHRRMAAAEPQPVGLRHLRPAALAQRCPRIARSPARCAARSPATASAATPSASGWCASRNRTPGRNRLPWFWSIRACSVASWPNARDARRRRRRRARPLARPRRTARRLGWRWSGDWSLQSPKPPQTPNLMPDRLSTSSQTTEQSAALGKSQHFNICVGRKDGAGRICDGMPRQDQKHQPPGEESRGPGRGGRWWVKSRVKLKLRADRGSGRSRTARAGAATCSGSRTRRR